MADDKNVVLAEKAYERCQEAYRAKDVELARIYLMNALTHNTELSYLKALVTIVRRTPSVQRKEVAQQALNMFSLALFQAPADQVVEIRKLVEEMQAIYDEAFAFDDNSTLSGPSSLGCAEILDEYSWSSMRKTGAIMNPVMMQEKGRVLQRLIDSGTLAEPYRARVESEFKETISYLDFVTKNQALREDLLSIEEELSGKGNLYYISAKLQNAASLLSQMWLLEVFNVVPREQVRLQLMEYVERMETLERKYVRLRGEPLFDELKARIDREFVVTTVGVAPKTVTLNRWQKLIRDVSAKIQDIQDPEQTKRLQDSLRKVTDSTERLSRDRFAEYQAFCAGKCRAAIKSFDDTIKVSESDAKNYLNRWELAKIDESLLSPEASSMYHEAKGMLVDKLSRIDRADFQVECVTCKKITLEDF